MNQIALSSSIPDSFSSLLPPVPLLVSTSSLVLAYLYLTSKPKPPLPPLVPYEDFFIGSTQAYKQDPVQFLTDAFAKYGPILRVNLFGRFRFIVDRVHAKDIFSDDTVFSFPTAIEKASAMDIIFPHQGNLTAREAVVNFITPYLTAYTPRVVHQFEKTLEERLGETSEIELDKIFLLIHEMVAKAMASVFVGEKLAKDHEILDTFANLTAEVGVLLIGVR